MSKVDARLLVAIGLAIGGTSLLWMSRFYLDVSFRFMMTTRIVQSLALAFLFVPLNTLAFKGIEPAQTNHASALINLARNFGGSIGISFASTLLTRREQFHQSRAGRGRAAAERRLFGLRKSAGPRARFDAKFGGHSYESLSADQ